MVCDIRYNNHLFLQYQHLLEYHKPFIFTISTFTWISQTISSYNINIYLNITNYLFLQYQHLLEYHKPFILTISTFTWISQTISSVKIDGCYIQVNVDIVRRNVCDIRVNVDIVITDGLWYSRKCWYCKKKWFVIFT
jgi:hypothetical protein